MIVIDDAASFRPRLNYMIVDGQVPSEVMSLGRYTTVYSQGNKLILRREPVSPNISFAIVIATYYRKNMLNELFDISLNRATKISKCS